MHASQPLFDCFCFCCEPHKNFPCALKKHLIKLNITRNCIIPEIESISVNCLPQPCINVLHIQQVIRSFDNSEIVQIILKKDNYQLYTDGLDFEM